MPPPIRKKVAKSYAMWLGRAAGSSIGDFYALGHSSEYDDDYAHQNQRTAHSPTARFSHIFHYSNGVRDQVHLLSDRALELFQAASGETLCAGFPHGVFRIEASGLTETAFKNHDGVFTGIWGPSANHIFACCMMPPTILERVYGGWQPMPLPALESDVLTALNGFSAQDVYCVGSRGVVLHYDGRTWRLLEVPTTRNLRCVQVLGDKLCIGGNEGIFLYGDRHGFRHISSGTSGMILGFGNFQGAAFFGTDTGVYRFDGKQAPTLALAQPAAYVTGLNDGLFIQYQLEAWTWDGQTLLPLDTIL